MRFSAAPKWGRPQESRLNKLALPLLAALVLAAAAASRAEQSGAATVAAEAAPAASERQLPQRFDQSNLVNQVVQQKSPSNGRQFGDTINDIHIECNSDSIVVTLTTQQGFNGMIYPKGMSKNSTCMTEYHQLTPNITYYLPLKSCNTMSSIVEDGVEYFNTVMIQPHRRLVTNQGRGYHIRCRYQTRERTITNQEQQLSVNLTSLTPSVMGSATMPSCQMRIFSANDLSHEVAAENVRIGDELHLAISLDDQDVYGMLVTNCLVRDGMNLGEQPLIDDFGCPVDEEIMPKFEYSPNLTRAAVTFQAHKFPYTSSVYYQCNVRLCFRDGGCNHVPPNCNNQLQATRGGGAALRLAEQTGAGNELRRNKRWVDGGELDGVNSDEVLKQRAADEMSIEVSSGLRVDETPADSNADGGDPIMAAATNDDPQESAQAADAAKPSGAQSREFCMSLRRFAIAISLISLLLMLLIIIMIACMIQRRNRRKLEEARMRH